MRNLQAQLALASVLLSHAPASEIFRYSARAADVDVRIETVDVENSLSRLNKIEFDDALKAIASPFGSARLAKKIVAHIGLRMDPAALAAVLQREATRHLEKRQDSQAFAIEQIIVFDKNLARKGSIPSDVRAFVEYRANVDLLIVKDSPARWILVQDSNAEANAARRIWNEGIWDHEYLTMEYLLKKRTSELHEFFLEITDRHFSPLFDSKEAAAGKILFAWMTTVLACGSYDAERAHQEWLKSRHSGSTGALLSAAGGAEALQEQFSKWAANLTQAREVAKGFSLK